MPPKNQLYYGDNFEVLQRYVRDETVDLVYLDPPFVRGPQRAGFCVLGW